MATIEQVREAAGTVPAGDGILVRDGRWRLLAERPAQPGHFLHLIVLPPVALGDGLAIRPDNSLDAESRPSAVHGAELAWLAPADRRAAKSARNKALHARRASADRRQAPPEATRGAVGAPEAPPAGDAAPDRGGGPDAPGVAVI